MNKEKPEDQIICPVCERPYGFVHCQVRNLNGGTTRGLGCFPQVKIDEQKDVVI